MAACPNALKSSHFKLALPNVICGGFLVKRLLLATVVYGIFLTGCSISSETLGPNSYELSGYFDFTMKGEVVVQGLIGQAQNYCSSLGKGLEPKIYYVTYQNRVFDYQAPRASAVIRFHCVKPEVEVQSQEKQNAK